MPVNINNEPDIASIIVPALTAFLPANADTAVNRANISNRSLITIVALDMVDVSIFPSIAMAPDITSREVDIASMPNPALPAFSPASLLATMTRANDSNILLIEARLFSIVMGSISARSSNVFKSIFKEMTRDIRVTAAPTLTLPHALITITKVVIILSIAVTLFMTVSVLSVSRVANASTRIFTLAATATKVIEPFVS